MNKIDILNTLVLINSERTYPISITGGDFNMITRLEDKRAGRAKLDNESIHFRNFIQDNCLIDMSSSNGVLTCNNKRARAQQITSHLDQFLLSDNEIHLGGDFTTSILPIIGSNHWPIKLQWQRPGNTTHRPLHFKAFYMLHPDFNNLIQAIWKNSRSLDGTKMYRF